MQARHLVPVILLAALGDPIAAHDQRTSSCEEAKRTNAWCTTDNVGYVASVPVPSRYLYEVLDAHGHEIIKSEVTCATCRKALETDGYCAAHRMGYFHGEAYMSPLTWHLARARRIDPAKITCPICRKHTKGIGWCDKDRLGIAGYFAIDNHDEFQALEAAYGLLLAANQMVARCENCAGAMIADGYCAIHRLRYQAGKATPVPQP